MNMAGEFNKSASCWLRIVSSLFLASAFATAQAIPRPKEHISGAGLDIRRTEIADGIYQFTVRRDSYVRQLNSVVVVTNDSVLVFDTNTRPSSARSIIGEIRKLTDKPVRYVVNSHWHPDHWSGNEEYAKAFPGVQIIATEHTRDTMQNVASLWPAQFQAELKRQEGVVQAEIATGKQADGAVLTPENLRSDEDDLRDYKSFVEEALALHRVFPNLTYVEKMNLFLGGREFDFMSVTGDAEGTTVMYLPNEKVLVTGDAISYPIPYITPPPSRQAQTLRGLAQIDWQTMVPGHGPAFHDRDFLQLELELLESVTREVRQALRRGMTSLEQIQSAVTAESLRQRFTNNDEELDARFRARVKVLVQLAVREARDGQDLR